MTGLEVGLYDGENRDRVCFDLQYLRRFILITCSATHSLLGFLLIYRDQFE